VGTELGRNVFGEDIWTLQLEALMRRIANNSDGLIAGWTVTDVRFHNEVEFIKFNGTAPTTLDKELNRLVQSTTDAAALAGLPIDRAVDLNRELYEAAYEREFANGWGVTIWIESDRPTLTGEAALHPSETQFDDEDRQQLFDYIIINNCDTTLDDLRDQLSPIADVIADRYEVVG
jgi:hypothetical protein